jgi:hypothetical protein
VFNKTGNTTAAWADKARAALEARARQNAHDYRDSWAHSAATAQALKDAVAAGCDDPMVLYLHAPFLPPGDDVTETGIRRAEAVYAGSFPAVQKMHACVFSLGWGRGLPAEAAEKTRATWRPRFLSQIQEVAGLRDHYLMTAGILDRQLGVRDATAGANLKKLTMWHVATTGLTKHLGTFPTDHMARAYLARFAVEAEKYELARQLFDTLPKGGTPVKPFGTAAKFNEFRDLAAAKAPPKDDK